MDAIRQRHNDALETIGAKIRHALVRSKSGAELRLNQTVPGYTGAALRPDIVVRDVTAKTLMIADLAATFEYHSPGAAILRFNSATTTRFSSTSLSQLS
ncbi:hypothetical protein DD237_008601 [Peronospora effusa]|uniref:Uncharacterized protein n=1 Tax=Peronospora effusa TaxID=542832 RepID=A0A425C148_9STRA|nr:hypothetical protein DD237_008601 [Peronospora effusa]